MLFNLIVALYTSRVVVAQLGIDDYGIYNVVGGIVTLFTLLSNSMTSSISRFITVDLVKGSDKHINDVFSTSINIQLLLGLIVLFLIETIGLWFLNYKMNISPQRIYAANWVLQCSVITFIINMVSTPYNACIIAHERMSAFAYISILETILKLGSALMLMIKLFDTLITYAILTTFVAIIIRIIYGNYCSNNFKECKYKFVLNKQIFKEIFSFSGWSFIGASAGVLRSQGVNILMNLFFGTVINAARGLAVQVYTAVNGFSTNFMTAINPQIIKSFTNDNFHRTVTLLITGSKFSFFLLLTISIPILVKTPVLLSLWLTEVPDYTVTFVRLSLFLGLSDTLSNSLMTVNQASGKIKTYQIVVGGLQLLNFPLVYFAYKLNCSPPTSYIIAIVVSQICLFARLLLVKDTIKMTIRTFLYKVYFRVFIVGISCLVPMFLLESLFSNTLLGIFLQSIISISWTLIIIYSLGCTIDERLLFNSWIKKIICKLQ